MGGQPQGRQGEHGDRSTAPERVELRLTFEKPWKATNRVVFDLRPQATGTDVTWRMTGTNKGFAALFSKVVPMDRMVGKDFEKGLARMKSAAETSSQRSSRQR